VAVAWRDPREMSSWEGCGIPYSSARVNWRAKSPKEDGKERQRAPWGGREVSSKV
jgi:hypothetical protein